MIGLYLLWRCFYTVIIPLIIICGLMHLLFTGAYLHLIGACLIIITSDHIVSWMNRQHLETVDVYGKMQRPNPQDQRAGHPAPMNPVVGPLPGSEQ